MVAREAGCADRVCPVCTPLFLHPTHSTEMGKKQVIAKGGEGAGLSWEARKIFFGLLTPVTFLPIFINTNP